MGRDSIENIRDALGDAMAEGCAGRTGDYTGCEDLKGFWGVNRDGLAAFEGSYDRKRVDTWLLAYDLVLTETQFGRNRFTPNL
jgi:hypothetical protein